MAETNALALFPYVADLFGGMIDLLQLESVPATAPLPKESTELSEPNPDSQGDGKGSRDMKAEDYYEGSGKGKGTEPRPSLTMVTDPTVADPKSPPLRRAALHFLTLLIRECVSRIYDMGFAGMLIPNAHLIRARTTLGYVASTDEDAVVRIMAREAREGLGQLADALIPTTAREGVLSF